MKPDEARQRLAEAKTDDEEPVCLPLSVLGLLDVHDMVQGTSFEVGELRGDTIHLDWNGTIHRVGDALCGEIKYAEPRKYWCSRIKLELYMDLIRRAVEVRHQKFGDVSLTHYEDDGAFIFLDYEVHTSEHNLGEAYVKLRKIVIEIEEVAQRAAD